MIKGRTTNNVQLKKNQSIKKKKKNGCKRSFEQERFKDLDTKEESNVEVVKTESYLSDKDETVNDSSYDLAKDDEHEEESKYEEALIQKAMNMEKRIEKLEQELREVASLEISLYSVVPDHSSSAHKLHTPARRISRLYIHACEHWCDGSRSTVARNTVSGLILVAKSCGNDVSRLTFWLSNIITLREIVSKSHVPEQSCSERSCSQTTNKSNGFKSVSEEPQETFTAALEKVESWIFSRIVESVWWQVFTPNMQSPGNDDTTNEKLDGTVFSISLWKKAFEVALSRLCPMRGAGHECGCLPILAKMVMEKCIARVDVAMFNAILRESEHQIPTDPVSDPILDSKVLPIPSGDLSFGSGAQLKNAIGNWSRCLDEMFDIINTRDTGDGDDKTFILLNELSDLLMLPKDMLIERAIREEVCPSISLSLIKRILCNFTPDEFCPDHVPGTILEELNAESVLEQKLSEVSFPYAASSVSYIPPSSVDVAEKIAEVGVGEGESSKLLRNVSMIQRKGYTSDEELEELDSPLASIIEKVSVSTHNGKVKQEAEHMVTNSRYKLLKDVWIM